MDNMNKVKILEVSKVSLSSSSTHSPSNFSLFLTPFDWTFLNFPPIERLLFYPLTHSDPPFLDSIVPKLKQSLSLTLHHFLPVAGNLIWPQNSPKPFILYTPNDAVSFTVAETDSDFNHFSSSQVVEIQEYRSLIPSLQLSETQAPLLSVQVTKFQKNGFSIGLCLHHILFDGKSLAMFLKAWAYICKQLNESESFSSLLPELTPSFDRTSSVLQTPSDFIPQNKSLNSFAFPKTPSNWFHGTFELTHKNIEKLKKRVLDSMEKSSSEEMHLSTFVVAYAYVLVCLIKAKEEESEDEFVIMLTADARGVLDPPISSNYFGDCLKPSFVLAEGREFMEEEEGFSNIAKKISNLVLTFKNRSVIKVEKPLEIPEGLRPGMKCCSVADSPKFKLYETEFGWGKPKKIVMVSLGNYNVSLADARDEAGSVQVGVVLPTHYQMDIFASLFSKGLC